MKGFAAKGNKRFAFFRCVIRTESHCCTNETQTASLAAACPALHNTARDDVIPHVHRAPPALRRLLSAFLRIRHAVVGGGFASVEELVNGYPRTLGDYMSTAGEVRPLGRGRHVVA